MNNSPKLQHALFGQESASHTVSVIKAGPAHGRTSESGKLCNPGQKSSIKMVGTGPDFCDLEFICGCGETTRLRCWNTASALEERAAA